MSVISLNSVNCLALFLREGIFFSVKWELSFYIELKKGNS